MHRPYSTLCKGQNTNFILARRNWAERHWMYSGHYPRIFVAPKNAQNTETKRWLGTVPILLLAISASTTGTNSSLNVLQGLNSQPQLLKEPVYHSATSAVGVMETFVNPTAHTTAEMHFTVKAVLSSNFSSI
jgi:hypothetical protein